MRTSTTSYLTEVSLTELVTVASSEPPLDEQREAALALRVRDGDLDALERLVMGNLRIAVDEAIRNRGLGSSQGALIRYGVRTLMEAARSYDPDRHGSSSRYASRLVRTALSENVSHG